jgi:Na+-transporting NADH:ubiquinone oxidoreductase subunit C
MKSVKDIAFIFIVALFFAGLTAGVNQALVHRITLNEENRNTKFLLDVMEIEIPEDATPDRVTEVAGKRIQKAETDGQAVYRAVDENGRPTGYAFKIGGKGFWGAINGLISLESDLTTIKDIVFTSHNETPGLGARIEEPWFREQFKGLKLTDKSDDNKYIHIALSGGGGDQKNRVDAITGATMTSTALEKILNEDLKRVESDKDKIRRIQWASPQAK